MARPTYNLHQHLNITDSEPTNGKLFCVNQQHASIHQPTQHIQFRGDILKTSEGQYLSDETTNSILRVRKGSSLTRIRVGVPHMTKFDMVGARCWMGFDTGGLH